MTAHDLYADVTASIVARLEAGNLAPWRCPWTRTGGGFPLRHNGIPYRGVNVFILWLTSLERGYTNPHFFTFKQASELGGCVRKGEKSTAILWCEPRTKKETLEDGTEEESRFWLSKIYRVFCAEQIDNLPAKYLPEPREPLDTLQRIEQADTFISNTGATIRHEEDRAYYRPSTDSINMPKFETFTNPEAYYATSLHELTHWTGHPSRLNRIPLEKQPKADYAKEEIVAELASAFLTAQLGIESEPREDHASYLQSWITAMHENPRYIFLAAASAQKATDFLNALQPSVSYPSPARTHTAPRMGHPKAKTATPAGG